MSEKRKHSRRLSLFGLGTSHPLSSGELTPRPNTAASITLAISAPAKQADEKSVPSEVQRRPIRRKLSKRRKPEQKNQNRQIAPSPPPTSYSQSNTHLSELSHESDVPCTDQRRLSLKRKSSMNVRAALSAIFMPKPSRKTVSGILDHVEGISGGKAIERRKKNERGTYRYDSRSPSPPSPEIRPPSGLGQIASSVDLASFIQEEYERGSLIRTLSGHGSRTPSRTPSVIHFIPTPPSDDVTANGTPDTKSLSSRELFYQPSSQQPTAPSQILKEVLELSTPYFPLDSLSSLASASCEFLHSARISLYTSIDSDDVGEDEKRRRGILQAISGNAEIAAMVKSIRWVCPYVAAPSPSSSSLNTKRNIPRRLPTVSLSSSPEEYVLPRVLSLVPNLETLVLLQPHRSVLQYFLPAHHSSQRSPSDSPVSSSFHCPPLVLTSLRSLTLSGRTTLSTTFGSILVRFLELHPGIRELNLPDVFCLPNVHSLSRHGSSSSSHSSSPTNSSAHEHGKELIPPVPPIPPTYLALKDSLKEPAAPSLLPNLTKLSAPLTLATQLVPGRPVRAMDVEISTSLYEGLRPTELARALAEAREIPKQTVSEDAKSGNWRAARHSRRFGLDALPITPITPTSPMPTSPVPSVSTITGGGEEMKPTNWKAARQARRAGIAMNNAVKQTPSLRELRMRCAAKVDCRTIGRVLIALGKELGEVLEVLVIEWCGSEGDLHTQLTLTLSRFSSLHRLEISASIKMSSSSPELDDDGTNDRLQEPDNSESDTDLETSISTERNLVEQWSRLCPQLSHIEFTSGRIWRASAC